ncbi:hypothetical protein CC80DRAFT_530300 [Byssothecium circinans]|uniref:Uncharacterized protein n=1 Tax=Byssothecium circinans TaxID=147558 RepID=A0A6A5UF86_9PLEO|nr:hypothetical protein CC80DRAFT_530300 [Byssothecium circinans]
MPHSPNPSPPSQTRPRTPINHLNFPADHPDPLLATTSTSPALPPPTLNPSPIDRGHIDRDSAIALGVLPLLILLALTWTLYTHLQHRRKRHRRLKAQRLALGGNTHTLDFGNIVARRAFRVEKQDLRQWGRSTPGAGSGAGLGPGGEAWCDPREMRGIGGMGWGMGNRTSVSTLPRYEERAGGSVGSSERGKGGSFSTMKSGLGSAGGRKDSGRRWSQGEKEKKKERGWWNSVVRYASTSLQAGRGDGGRRDGDGAGAGSRARRAASGFGAETLHDSRSEGVSTGY